MRCFQRAANLLNRFHRLAGRKFSVPPQQRPQIIAFHVLHGDEPRALRLAEVVNPHHVLVGHVPRQNQFLLEALQNAGISRKLGTNHLQRDDAIQFLIACLVDGTHAALAQRFQNAVTPGEDRPGAKECLLRQVSVRNRCDWRGRSGTAHRTAGRHGRRVGNIGLRRRSLFSHRRPLGRRAFPGSFGSLEIRHSFAVVFHARSATPRCEPSSEFQDSDEARPETGNPGSILHPKPPQTIVMSRNNRG